MSEDNEILELRKRVRALIAERDALSLKVQWMEINVALKWESKYLVVLHENLQLRKSAQRISPSDFKWLQRQVQEATTRCDVLRKKMSEIAGGEL